MITLRLKLTWPDGAAASAEITTAAANDRAPVTYAGATERLPFRFPECAASTLREVFRSAALEQCATLSVDQSGDYPDENDVQ